MSKNARIYDFTLTAGGSFSLPVEGDYVRIMTATGTVELLTDVYRLGPIAAGQGQSDSPFKRLTINDKSGAPNVGTILVASSGFIDQRISGEVSVIDGEKSRTLAGGMFAGAPTTNGVAVSYASVQLWNPTGSGKNLIVTQMDYSWSAASAALVLFTQTQLANVYGVPAVNKKSNGAIPLGLLKYETKAAPETFTLGILKNNYLQANQVVVWAIKGALVVTPGYGLNIYQNTVAYGLNAGFEWFEESA